MLLTTTVTYSWTYIIKEWLDERQKYTLEGIKSVYGMYWTSKLKTYRMSEWT